jgi:putative oxidoreductase
MAIFSRLGKYTNIGLLLMRVGLGAMMIAHGYPKLMGGPEMWTKIGGAMHNMGITVYPTFWGLMAGLTESIGGLLLILGLAFRPACLFLLFTMCVAATKHYYNGDSLLTASHAIELGFVFLGLFFIGPGRYSVDKS